ncbi:MAG: hypothetical protein ABUK01_01420 [Leptospirales bacterium]
MNLFWKFKWVLFFVCFTFSQFCTSLQENNTADTSIKSEVKTPAQIQEQINALLTLQVDKYDKDQYPRDFGIDSRNNFSLIIVFICPGECKDEPILFLIYKNVDEKTCKDRKIGDSLYSLQNGNYIGCEPFGL